MIAALPPATPQITPATTLESLRETISASRLSCWLQCRLRFYFRYVLKLAKPVTPALIVGQAVHAVLRRWNLARWHGEAASPEALEQAFQEVWNAPGGVRWDGKEVESRALAQGLWKAYLESIPQVVDTPPKGVEVSVETDLSSHGLPILRGVLDLVTGDGRIVDYKTSAQTQTDERLAHNHELQLAAYGVLYRHATGEQESGFEIHSLIKTKQPKITRTELPPMTERQQSRLFRSIESYVDGLERKDFVPSPGMGCMGCEFFNECRKWDGETHHEQAV